MNPLRITSPVKRVLAFLLGAFLALGAILPAAAQTTVKRWFPGHYLYAADDVNHRGMMDSRRDMVRTNPYFAGYKNQYWWHRLEPTKGVYDFSMILADLDKAHADGKKMIVLLMDRSFHASTRPFPVPAYIRDELNGTWQDGEKIFIKTWDPAVTERYILLVEALAKAVDAHPAFQMLFTEESGMSGITNQSGYSHAKVADFWSRLSARAAPAFKQGIFSMNFNWGLSSSSSPSREQLTDKIVLTDRNAIGASDLRISGDTGTLTTSFGYVYDRYAGTAPLHASVEYNTYAKGWSAKELLDFGVDRLGLHFIAWMARTSTSGVTFNIHDAIDEINQQAGRINKTSPTNMLSGSSTTESGATTTDSAIATTDNGIAVTDSDITTAESGTTLNKSKSRMVKPTPPRELRAYRW